MRAFLGTHLPKDRREALARALRSGPWLWPADGDAAGLEVARGIAGCTCVPATTAGHVLLVAVDTSGSSLWAFGPARRRCDNGVTDLGPSARATWNRVAEVLPRVLPILWRSVRQAADEPWAGVHLLDVPRPGWVSSAPYLLEGESFGLSFFLALASHLTGTAVPASIVASAVLDAEGRAHPVDGLEDKIHAAAQLPRIETFIVAAAQGDLAREAALRAGASFVVVPVQSSAQALREIFGEPPFGEAMLLRSIEDEAARAELVDSLFRLAISGRDQTVAWTPVERAASLILDRAEKHLSKTAQNRLCFARAVASRHEGFEDVLPDLDWLESMAITTRLAVVANYVQHSADTGRPAAEEALALAERHLVRGADAFTEHLQLLGASARLLAVTGRADEALARQREAAEGFLDRDGAKDLSYPVSEWYRLAGALENEPAFRVAEQLVERASHRLAIDLEAQPYVRLARGRALVMLGSIAGPEPERTLQTLAESAPVPHVRWSALRWWARQAAVRGDRVEARRIRSILFDRWARELKDPLRAFAELARIDAALEDGDEVAAGLAQAALRSAMSGPTSHLLAQAPYSGESAAAHIARFFPY